MNDSKKEDNFFKENKLVSRKEAADFLGLKPQTLQVWQSKLNKELPYIKVGHLVKYRVSDLEDFVKRQTIK